MGSGSSPQKDRLVELVKALQSLRKTLSSGPERMAGIRYLVEGAVGVDLKKFPLAVAVKKTADKVRCLLRGGENQVKELVDDSIAPRSQLNEVLCFLDTDVDLLDSLPAGPVMRRKLDVLIQELGGQPAKQPPDSAAWCHDVNEPRPDHLWFGPLTGQAKELNRCFTEKTDTNCKASTRKDGAATSGS